MADSTRIRYVGTAGAYEDGGVTFNRNDKRGAEVEPEQAEKLLALQGEHEFEEVPSEVLKEIEEDEKAKQAAEEGAQKIQEQNEKDAASRAAFYGAESQDEIDEAFGNDPDTSVPSTEKEPEAGPVSEDADSAADDFRSDFDDEDPEDPS